MPARPAALGGTHVHRHSSAGVAAAPRPHITPQRRLRPGHCLTANWCIRKFNSQKVAHPYPEGCSPTTYDPSSHSIPLAHCPEELGCKADLEPMTK